MRFLIDNALSPRVAEGLRQAGHDAVHVGEIALAHATDEVIFDCGATEARIVVSEDTDFGTLLATRQSARPSVILFRGMQDRRAAALVAVLLLNLPTIEASLAEGAMVVIKPQRMRIRRLPFGSPSHSGHQGKSE